MNAELLRELARIARSSELHDLRVGLTPDETDALASMLEREHEEVERLRSRLEMIHAACASYEECPVDARDRPESWARLWRLLDAARKGVSDE